MASVIRLGNPIFRRLIAANLSSRCISTSKKNTDTAVTTADTSTPDPKVRKNWVSFGFEINDEEEDRINMHWTFFFSVTLLLVGGGFYLIYLPDYTMRDWAQREGFLELRRRERLGLPLVDPNIIDPSKVVLPTDEELGDTDIII